MSQALYEYCIYTILHTDVLSEAAQQAKPCKFRESKAWVTGHRLWRDAQKVGLGFPLLLGDATDCSRLEYWGVLSKVEIKGNVTHYTVDRVRPLSGSHTPQELILRRTGVHIAPNFIRPYAICRTPGFLRK